MSAPTVRVAGPADARAVARSLRAFNLEFDDPAPDEDWLTDRLATLLLDDTVVLVTERPDDDLPAAFALMRLRPSLWDDADEAYLAELYVRPELRGQGLGRALLLATVDEAVRRGATYMDLTTTNRDEAAVALYESVGFDRHERRGDGTDSYYFELDLPR